MPLRGPNEMRLIRYMDTRGYTSGDIAALQLLSAASIDREKSALILLSARELRKDPILHTQQMIALIKAGGNV